MVNVTYFNSFEVEHISREIKKYLGNKNVTTNFYRIQGYVSVMCRYFCIGIINLMFKGKFNV